MCRLEFATEVLQYFVTAIMKGNSIATDLFGDGVSRYKPEDWENNPLETTASPERAATVIYPIRRYPV